MKTYIIAEIGINHEGLLSRSKKLIKIAKLAGANAVKFQLFEPETLASDKSKKTNDQNKLMKKETLFDMWKRVKLSSDELLILKKYAKKNNIDFFCSVFDFPSLKIVKKLKINTIKIASSDITDIPLLKKIAKTKMKIFLSTGMASLKEINKALKILGKNKLTLLHCVSLYPCPLNKANIKRMIKLKKKFNVKIGYSDHCEGIDASLIAINNGASVIEKHFTDDKKRKGADHKLSADFSDLKQIVEYSNSKDTIMGDGIINPKKDELNMRKFARKSLFYDKDLNYKQKIKFEDIKIRRPFGEMEPIKIYSIINKKLKQSVKKGEIVKKKHFM